MSTPAVDIIWAKDQMKRLEIHPRVQEAVIELLNTWETVEVITGLIPDIIKTFAELAQNHALLPDASEETWVEGFPGAFRTGDIVRVRHDAFDGDMGSYHNGRVGRVLGVRSGSVIFRSTDEIKPFIDGAHYQADKLEKRLN